jgi:hypothetical protein
MAGSTIQPKWFDVGVHAVVCTQAIASAAASDQDYKLFAVASGMTILDAVGRLSAGINATNTYWHMGIASGGKTLVSTGTNFRAWPQRGGPDVTLPYSCTADTFVWLFHGAAATAAVSFYATVYVTNTETVD